MKRITSLFLIIAAILCITACKDGADDINPPENSVKMVATIDSIDDKITVTVTESEYTSGIHWVITGEDTEYYAKDGKEIARNKLNVGDTVEIYYSGQVMMSYPPQIVALQIRLK